MAAFQTRMNYRRQVTPSFTDDTGAPAPVEGAPVWTSSDPTAFAVEPAADGLSAWVVGQAGGVVGTIVQVTVEADADLGAGVVPVRGIVEFELTSGQATAVSMNVGEQEPVPSP